MIEVLIQGPSEKRHVRRRALSAGVSVTVCGRKIRGWVTGERWDVLTAAERCRGCEVAR